MREISINEYFHGEEYVENDLLESLLLNLVKDDEKRELHLVLDIRRTSDFYKHLETGVSQKNKSRLFYHFTFTDFFSLSVKGSSFSANSTVIYSAKNKGAGELQDYEVKEEPVLHIALKFDSDNQCYFNFEKLLFEQKQGYAVKREYEEVWDYFDIITKKQFDFYDPFNLNKLRN